MIRHPPRSTLLPNGTLYRSTPDNESRRPEDTHMQTFDRRSMLKGAAALGLAGAANLTEFAKAWAQTTQWKDRKSTRLNSSHANISYAVFCLKKQQLIPHCIT